jgi:hypothetical protein
MSGQNQHTVDLKLFLAFPIETRAARSGSAAGKIHPGERKGTGVFDTPTFSPIRFQTLKQSFGDVKKIMLDKIVLVVRELQVLY